MANQRFAEPALRQNRDDARERPEGWCRLCYETGWARRLAFGECPRPLRVGALRSGENRLERLQISAVSNGY